MASIEVAGNFVEFNLRTGQPAEPSEATSHSLARAVCPIPLWDVPAEIDLAMDDPVLIHTVCPSTPGSATQLTIMERAEIPLLAPLGTASDGEWVSGTRTSTACGSSPYEQYPDVSGDRHRDPC